MEALDPLPIAEADERDFATIIASAKGATISFSRRDVEGRLLGRSPLLGNQREVYLMPLVAGSATRGTILHKLMEEVLSRVVLSAADRSNPAQAPLGDLLSCEACRGAYPA